MQPSPIRRPPAILLVRSKMPPPYRLPVFPWALIPESLWRPKPEPPAERPLVWLAAADTMKATGRRHPEEVRANAFELTRYWTPDSLDSSLDVGEEKTNAPPTAFC